MALNSSQRAVKGYFFMSEIIFFLPMCHLKSFMLCYYINISNTDLNSDTKNRGKTNTFKDLFSQMLTIYHIPHEKFKVFFVWEKTSSYSFRLANITMDCIKNVINIFKKLCINTIHCIFCWGLGWTSSNVTIYHIIYSYRKEILTN